MSPSFESDAEVWQLYEREIDLGALGQTEALFALSNGHLGLRGNLDEGEPADTHGTYLSGFFENHPLPYPEGGYGYPESGQTIVNVTNGKIIRLLVDDEPFDLRYGRLLSHERCLDLRAGTLHRELEWESPAGRRVRIRSTRLVSFTQRSVAAIAYEVEAVDAGTRVIVQSELVTNEAAPEVDSADPRVADALIDPLQAVDRTVHRDGAILTHRTRSSELRVSAGMVHDIESPVQHDVENEAEDYSARTTVLTRLEPGQRLRVVKYLAYAWSSTRSATALSDQVAAALTSARYTGWDELLRSQREYLDRFWATADVEIEGDPVLQQAVRFGLFHVLQAGARAERRAIGAKGLTGTGYNGHTFWDIEGFALPVLSMIAPDAAEHALRWRASTLDLARQRAATLGLRGASFPWRTIGGEETSAYWPAGTAAFHINADIARAFAEYRLITGDETLERDCGVEVLVETARLWISLGHLDRDGRWHIQGITGPDEYTAIVDDNLFTNLMAQRNLRWAAEAAERHPDLAEAYGVSDIEREEWRVAAQRVFLPYDDDLGVHEQHSGFTKLGEWNFFAGPQRHPLMLHHPYFDLYRKQVIKQADLVLAMHWCGDEFTPGQKAANLDYYERRTVRDSSLSAGTQAVICAELGHLDLAHAYLHEAALVDLHDLHGNASQGMHIASLAAAWTALVDGFGGVRVGDSGLRIDPALPERITRMAFRIRWQGVLVQVVVTPEEVACSLIGSEAEAETECAGAQLALRLAGEDVVVRRDEPIRRRLRQRVPRLDTPLQPPGRTPARVNGEPLHTEAEGPVRRGSGARR